MILFSELQRHTPRKKYIQLQVYGIRPKNQLSDFKREVIDSLVFSRSETCIAISALIGVSLQEKKNVIEIAVFITFHNSQLKEGLTFETLA